MKNSNYRRHWRIVVGSEEPPVETANIDHGRIVRGNRGQVNMKIAMVREILSPNLLQQIFMDAAD